MVIDLERNFPWGGGTWGLGGMSTASGVLVMFYLLITSINDCSTGYTGVLPW